MCIIYFVLFLADMKETFPDTFFLEAIFIIFYV